MSCLYSTWLLNIKEIFEELDYVYSPAPPTESMEENGYDVYLGLTQKTPSGSGTEHKPSARFIVRIGLIFTEDYRSNVPEIINEIEDALLMSELWVSTSINVISSPSEPNELAPELKIEIYLEGFEDL